MGTECDSWEHQPLFLGMPHTSCGNRISGLGTACNHVGNALHLAWEQCMPLLGTASPVPGHASDLAWEQNRPLGNRIDGLPVVIDCAVSCALCADETEPGIHVQQQPTAQKKQTQVLSRIDLQIEGQRHPQVQGQVPMYTGSA